MTRETLSAILMVSGMFLPLAGWKRFRKPGVPFLRFAPLLHMPRYLYPAGVVMCWAGLAVALFGVAVRWLPV